MYENLRLMNMNHDMIFHLLSGSNGMLNIHVYNIKCTISNQKKWLKVEAVMQLKIESNLIIKQFSEYTWKIFYGQFI